MRAYLSTVQKNRLWVAILFGFILMGSSIGVCSFSFKLFCTEKFEFLFYLFPSLYNHKSSFLIFKSALLETGVLMTLSFLFGFSAIGQPFSCFLLLLHGFLFGISVINYTGDNMIQTFLNLISAIPYAIISSIILVIAVKESVRFSNSFFKYSFKYDLSDDICHKCRMYHVRYGILLFFLIASSLVYSFLVHIISVIAN